MAGLRAALLLLIAVAGLQAAQSQLVIEEAKRKIDITTFRARHQTGLTVRNDGRAAADSLLLCEAGGLMEHAAAIEVAVGDAKLQWAPAPAPEGAAGVACRRYTLPTPLAPGAKASLLAEALFTHVLRPEPAKIKQSEPQRVVYEDSAVLASPYAIEKQSTEIVVGTSSVPSFTSVPPSKQSGNSLRYGPYEAIAPLTVKPIAVHYENFAPFAQVTELEREIEVGQWGNVYFEERYTLRHAGAQIAGEWSRYDLMTRPAEFGRAAIAAVAAALPRTARSLYYRDAIGNISTSETRYGDDVVMVQLQPRFPLFGGWSVKFVFGWSMPLKDVVVKGPDGRLTFQAPIGPSIRGAVVDELTVKVVLPEGASAVDVTAGIPLEGPPTSGARFSYLDVLGRPVVVLRATNVVDEMNVPFKVAYSSSTLGLVQKPLLLAAFLGAVTAVVLAINRGSASLNRAAATQPVVKAHAS